MGEIFETDLLNAFFRLRDINCRGRVDDVSGPYVIGWDFAREGIDNSEGVLRNRWRIVDHVVIPDGTGLEEATQTRRWKSSYGDIQRICYDSTGGYHSGFENDMRTDWGELLSPVNFGSSSPDKNYHKMRTYIYSKLRDLIRDGFWLGDDPDLVDQLKATLYDIDADGRTRLVPKELIKRHLGGASPDYLDALATSAYHDIEDSIVSHRSASAPRGRWSR